MDLLKNWENKQTVSTVADRKSNEKYKQNKKYVRHCARWFLCVPAAKAALRVTFKSRRSSRSSRSINKEEVRKAN